MAKRAKSFLEKEEENEFKIDLGRIEKELKKPTEKNAPDVLWTRELNSDDVSSVSTLITDQEHNIIIYGLANPGGNILLKFSPDCEQLWKKQLGSFEWNEINSLLTDKKNNIIVGGYGKK